MSQMNAREVEEQYHQLAADREYKKALQLVSEHFNLFPPHAQRVVYFWRMKMACRLNDVQLALTTLREAVDNDHWYTDLDQNPDFQILADSTEFQELITICAQRRAEEIANAKSVMKILQPEPSSNSYPLLFALHGNSSNVEQFAPHWRHAQDHGWLVALPQSPQAHGPGNFSWNDWDWAIPAIVDHYSQVCKHHLIDQQRVVLAGFSMGAGLALWLALEQTLEVQGLICVAPFLSDVDALRPVLAQQRNQKLRMYLVASKEDEYCYDVAHKLSALFSEYEIEHRLDIYQDIGHSFPPSFENHVPNALDFILNGE
jgi:predicted esterase